MRFHRERVIFALSAVAAAWAVAQVRPGAPVDSVVGRAVLALVVAGLVQLVLRLLTYEDGD